MADKSRNYSGGRFAFELDGQVAGISARSWTAANAKSDVIVSQARDQQDNSEEHRRNVKFEDFKAELGHVDGAAAGRLDQRLVPR